MKQFYIMMGFNQNVACKTWTASFVEFLVKTCFLPISIKENKIIFKIISWKTFFHIFLSLSYFIASFLLMFAFGSTGFDKMLAGVGSYELVSLVLMGLSMVTALVIPAILSAGLASLGPEIILRNDLRFPKKAYRIIIGQ